MSLINIPGRRKPEPPAPPAPISRLEERRDQLRERFAELQWDLGGAAYEMAARDYFRLDVLAGMASRLQVVDAELAEIERMARLERAGAAGSCSGCGSLYARGAVYCWRCGRNLSEGVAGTVVGSAPKPAAPGTPPRTPDQPPLTPEKPPLTPETSPLTPMKSPLTPMKSPLTPDQPSPRPAQAPAQPVPEPDAVPEMSRGAGE